jgi:hypothetical protein
MFPSRSHEHVSRATRLAPFLAFVLRDPHPHHFLNKGSRQWLVCGEVDGPFGYGEALKLALKRFDNRGGGEKLQWFENAANHTSTPLYLNAGIR